MNTLINNRLNSLAESDYKSFNKKLISTNYNIIGVRMAALRKLAKEIVSEFDLSIYLNNAEYKSYEHIILYGLVLGYIKERQFKEYPLSCRPLDEPLLKTIFHYLDPHILRFDNWAHVDTIISSLKLFNKYPNEVIDHFLPLKTHDGEFTKRTFVVLLMSFFMDSTHIDSTLKHLSQIGQGQYYVDMAIAWALCEGLIKHYPKTVPLLQQQKFSVFVHNKAIQKARESYRVPLKTKEYLQTLKVQI